MNVSRSDGSNLCQASIAKSFVARGIGLLGRRSLADDEGLLIDPCKSVHTLFMRFPIDVIYLDQENLVTKIAAMKPFQLSIGGKGAIRALELPKNSIEKHGIQVGEVLSIGSGSARPNEQ